MVDERAEQEHEQEPASGFRARYEEKYGHEFLPDAQAHTATAHKQAGAKRKKKKSKKKSSDMLYGE
eukprot:COSAG06_NODE_15881_length_1038_cov_0.811502_2_plen_66_part_00